MILQALTDYYKTLADKGQISPPGWAQVKISYALCIDDSGVLEQVISLQTERCSFALYHRSKKRGH